jgi:hypothetical protein
MSKKNDIFKFVSMEKDKKNFPYQNLSLKNIPGERWKDIPDFEGLYKISNYGRIKSLKRSGIRSDGRAYNINEKIRRPKLETHKNETVNEVGYTLMITLNRDAKKYYFSIGRLLYYSFVEKFDLEDKKILISNRDHNGRNLSTSNLVKSNNSEMGLLAYKNARAVSHMSILSKPVTQFDSMGFPINNFPSMYEAQKHTGIDQREISSVVNGRIHISKGYFWRLGYKTKKLNLAKITRKKGQGEVIHKSLMKRLGIKKINNDQPSPLLNLSTKTMKGEKWKDLPYYEGLYQISNFGRIKSLRRISDGKIQKWIPEQIKRLTVDFRKDEDGKEVAGSTIINLSKNNQKKDFSVSRLVYYAFVKKIDLENRNIRVYYKDGISINCHYKNLFLQKAGWAINKK